ncbi:hypothetical protein INS49_003985 [Diaporthe citri]|uniref:uncharacterized protein n=1 Tax=Diaporthe citri TaxID=83186 RepID=UPI001C7F7DD8|nr:uncharacterized protein INS49_003985 [Diaporthe citri]KAG6354904.1 hypothetical protein INS49_003985 [Diaporthe citri]
MAPLNLTGDVISPLIRHFNNSPVAPNVLINARDSTFPDYSQPKINKDKIAAIIIGGVILAIIFVFIFCRTFEKITQRPERPMPQGQVYGYTNASSHALASLRPDRSYERPSFQHIENSGLGNRQSGGGAVAYPAPVVTHGRDRQDESPPPPYPEPPKYKFSPYL